MAAYPFSPQLLLVLCCCCALASSSSPVFLPPVGELRLTGFSKEDLRREATRFCGPLLTPAAREASGRGRWRQGDPWVTACEDKHENSRCKLQMGSEAVLGACTNKFFTGVATAPLLCVPAEVIVGAQTACQGAEDKPGDTCAYELEGERVEGVCGWDGAVSALGCVSQTAASFLQQVENVMGRRGTSFAVQLRAALIEPGSEIGGWEASGGRKSDGSTGGDAASTIAPLQVTVRLRPTADICAGEDVPAGSYKLPMQLELPPGAVSFPLLPGFPEAEVLELHSRHTLDHSLLRGALGDYVAAALNVTGAAQPAFARVVLDDTYIGLYQVRAAATPRLLAAKMREQDGLDAISAPANALGLVQATQAHTPTDLTKEVTLQAGQLVGQIGVTTRGWTRINTGQRRGWVPSWTLGNVSCVGLPATIYRPLSSLHSFQPSHWAPAAGNLPEPWWAPGEALAQALGPRPTLAGLRRGGMGDDDVVPEALSGAASPSALEHALNVPGLLRGLAAAAALRASKQYGAVAHTYSLAADPCTAQLQYVPDPMDALGSATVDLMTEAFDHATTPRRYRLIHAVLYETAWKDEYMWLGSEAQRIMAELHDNAVLEKVNVGGAKDVGKSPCASR
jgi:hypothetical protein